jgi:mannan endo-1,4-beta-mannosidase
LPALPFVSHLLCQIDVPTVPDAGSWLLLIKGGDTTINTGPDGFQRLDKIVELAKQYNIYVYFTLTNNWFPFANGLPSPFPRNFLCTDYGPYLLA